MSPAFTPKILISYLLVLFVSIILLPQHANAQATGGSIQGRITEDSGAPLSGASVTALQTDTSVSRTVTDGYVENTLSPDFGEPTTVVDEFRPRQVQLGFRVDF